MRRYKYTVGSFTCFNKTDLLEHLKNENEKSKISNNIINNYFSNKIKKPAEFLTTISRVKI
jgi:hypothetical protein